MKNKLLSWISVSKELISYLFFGVCTTIVNYAAFFLLKLCMDYRAANAIAWLVSVLFAYVTNKIWVFESRGWHLGALLREFCTFTGGRVISGLFDMGFLIFAVEILLLKEGIAKLIGSVVVVILNYIFSKLLVFRKK